MLKNLLKSSIYLTALTIVSIVGAVLIKEALAVWTGPTASPPSGNVSITAPNVSGWTDGGTSVYLSTLTDLVGIGTSAPNKQLHLYQMSGDNSEIDIQSIAGTNKHWAIYHDRTTQDFRIWNNDPTGEKNVLVIDNATGNIGIGTTNPRTTLDVAGPIRAGNYTTAARPACNASIAGAFIFDTTVSKPYVCNGSAGSWKPLDSDFDSDGIVDWNDQDDTDASKKTATLIPGNIKSGVTIFGVDGTASTVGGVTVAYLAPPSAGNWGGRSGADNFCASNMPIGLSCVNVHALISVSATDEIRDMPSNYGYNSTKPVYWWKNNSTLLGQFSIVDSGGTWANILDGNTSISAKEGTGIGGTDPNVWVHSGSYSDGSLYVGGNCSGYTGGGSEWLGLGSSTHCVFGCAYLYECSTIYLMCVCQLPGTPSIYSKTYTYTGSSEIFSAPYAGTYKFELWGGAGSSGCGGTGGGNGAHLSARINLAVGQQLTVRVGSAGLTGCAYDSNPTLSGGDYGGGAGGAGSAIFWGTYMHGGGGGGATDIRAGGTALSNRIIVAGGGGGGGAKACGSDGGAISNGVGDYNGYSIGFGSAGEVGTTGGGGGGGGYYGGWGGSGGNKYFNGNGGRGAGSGGTVGNYGSGSCCNDSCNAGGGGGGSSFISNNGSYIFSAPTYASDSTGNGKVVITYGE